MHPWLPLQVLANRCVLVLLHDLHALLLVGVQLPLLLTELLVQLKDLALLLDQLLQRLRRHALAGGLPTRCLEPAALKKLLVLLDQLLVEFEKVLACDGWRACSTASVLSPRLWEL